MPASLPLVLVLLGPTASGKSALALELASRFELTVLSVDSRQLYTGMDIGTAKPSAAERARVPHGLLDLRSPDQPLNLQEFRQAAEAAIAAEHQRRGVAFLVGGSGLYLQALTQGLQPPAVPPQPALRAQLAALGQSTCHQLLHQADPQAAGRIDGADTVRTQRALEVLYATGRSLSSQQSRQPPAWRVLELGLDPGDLRQRIASRTRSLYAGGLVEETQQLARRYGHDLPLLQTIGYGEALGLLAGELSEAQAISRTDQRTRQYAKRQRTWFRRRHAPLWLDPAADGADLLRGAEKAVEGVLG